MLSCSFFLDCELLESCCAWSSPISRLSVANSFSFFLCNSTCTLSWSATSSSFSLRLSTSRPKSTRCLSTLALACRSASHSSCASSSFCCISLFFLTSAPICTAWSSDKSARSLLSFSFFFRFSSSSFLARSSSSPWLSAIFRSLSSFLLALSSSRRAFFSRSRFSSLSSSDCSSLLLALLKWLTFSSSTRSWSAVCVFASSERFFSRVNLAICSSWCLIFSSSLTMLASLFLLSFSTFFSLLSMSSISCLRSLISVSSLFFFDFCSPADDSASDNFSSISFTWPSSSDFCMTSFCMRSSAPLTTSSDDWARSSSSSFSFCSLSSDSSSSLRSFSSFSFSSFSLLNSSSLAFSSSWWEF